MTSLVSLETCVWNRLTHPLIRSLDTKMKRTKYNNGGLHTSYSKGVFGLEGNASGNQKQRAVSATASVRGKNSRASVAKNTDTLSGKSTNYNASVYGNGMSAFVNKNSNKGGSTTTYGMQKQLPNRSSVSAQKNKYNTSASYNKQTKGGTDLKFGVSQNAQGTLSASMSFSKPL